MSSLKLTILDFDIKQPTHTKFKAVLSSLDENEVQQQVVVNIQRLEIPEIEPEEILDTLNKFEFCPGIEENQILPLLSQFGNASYMQCIMFLIEKVASIVVYRSRDCEIVTDGGERLCSSCEDLYQNLQDNCPEEESYFKQENEEDDTKIEVLIPPFPELTNKISKKVENDLCSIGINKNKRSRFNWSDSEKETFLKIIQDLDGGNVGC